MAKEKIIAALALLGIGFGIVVADCCGAKKKREDAKSKAEQERAERKKNLDYILLHKELEELWIKAAANEDLLMPRQGGVNYRKLVADTLRYASDRLSAYESFDNAEVALPLAKQHLAYAKDFIERGIEAGKNANKFNAAAQA